MHALVSLVSILNISQLLPASAEFSDTLIDFEIYRNMSVCSEITFCQSRMFNLSSIENGTLSLCCISCPCGPDCLFPEVCCFGVSGFKNEEHYMSTCHTTNLFGPTNKFELDDYYDMIDKCPSESIGTTDEVRANYVPLRPVFSTQTNKTYSSSECAECYNVTDVRDWTVALVARESIGEVRLSEELISIINGESTGKFLMKTLPPGDTHIEKCLSFVGKCKHLEEFRHSYPDFDKHCTASVEMQWLNGQSESVYLGDDYCFVCNIRRQALSQPGICSLANVSPQPGLFRVTLQSFVDNKFKMEMLFKATTKHLCKMEDIYGRKLKVCREIFCPEPKTFYNGRCRLLYDTWHNMPFRMVVQIVPEEPIPIQYMRLLNARNSHIFDFLGLPGWTIRAASFHLAKSGLSSAYIILEMEFTLNKIRSSLLFGNLERVLKSVFTLRLQNVTRNCTVHLSNYKQFQSVYGAHEIFGYGPVRAIIPRIMTTENKGNKILLYQNPFEITVFYENVTTITKLYFCEQIELKPSEYTDHTFAVYIKSSKTYLDEGQFSMNNNKNIRVCIDDIGGDVVHFSKEIKNAGTKTCNVIFMLAIPILSTFLFKH